MVGGPDFVPDCGPSGLLGNVNFNPNPGANPALDSCGAFSNANYGTANFTNTFDPDLRTGWGKRSYNWEFSASVQQELLPRVGMEVGYFRRWFGNQIVTSNRALDGRFGCGSPTDHSGCFDQFNYTVPSDPKLPDGGGYLGRGDRKV